MRRLIGLLRPIIFAVFIIGINVTYQILSPKLNGADLPDYQLQLTANLPTSQCKDLYNERQRYINLAAEAPNKELKIRYLKISEKITTKWIDCETEGAMESTKKLQEANPNIENIYLDRI